MYGHRPTGRGAFANPAVQTSASDRIDWQLSLPELTTERLRLRPFRAGDHDAAHRIMAAPETFEFSERGPMSSDESWSRLLRHAGNWALLGYGMFAVVEQSSGRIVGEVGHADFRRGLGPSFDGVPEATWTLAPDAWGCGYAIEAAGAAHAWLRGSLGHSRTVCLVHRDNRRSIRLAARLGYRAFDEIDYRGYRAVLFERASAAGGHPSPV